MGAVVGGWVHADRRRVGVGGWGMHTINRVKGRSHGGIAIGGRIGLQREKTGIEDATVIWNSGEQYTNIFRQGAKLEPILWTC